MEHAAERYGPGFILLERLRQGMSKDLFHLNC